VRESGRAFAGPTYLSIAGVLVMVVVGLTRALFGQAPVPDSAGWQVHPHQVGLTGLALSLRAQLMSCPR
jgi:hypothetical protein